MSIIDEKSIQEAKPYELSIAGFKLKLNSTLFAVAIPVLTTLGGAAWGGFQFYTDYMNMRAKIEKYIAPDLTTFDKRLAVIEENSQKQLEYTRDIKIDLKNDVRRLDDVVSDVERTAKTSQRETDNSVRDLRSEVRSIRGDMESTLKANNREVQSTVNELKRENQSLERRLEGKIKQALDNPLANR
jgi:tetrahydromethanopterin S-methyltransferase subunit F